MVVLNGLHEAIDAPNVVNLRTFDPAERKLASGYQPRSVRVLTIGTSGGMGKLTTTVLLARALRAAGVTADWLPTGQTGVMLKGSGHVLDSVPLDFAPGVLERDLVAAERTAELVVIEGQGSLRHPSFGAAGFVLTKVCRPQWFVACHRLGVERHTGFDQPVPPVAEVVAAQAELSGALGFESALLGVALDSADVPAAEYRRKHGGLEAELGVPCVDPAREGVEAISARLAETMQEVLSGSSS